MSRTLWDKKTAKKLFGDIHIEYYVDAYYEDMSNRPLRQVLVTERLWLYVYIYRGKFSRNNSSYWAVQHTMCVFNYLKQILQLNYLFWTIIYWYSAMNI
jgi:hypothetical protein